MALFSKGIMLTQHKEPALSAPIVKYTTPQPSYFNLKDEITQNPDEITPREIINIAKAADIIDEGDGRPLVSKLRRVEGQNAYIIVDAIDDEPYVSSKLAPMLQFQEDFICGLRLAAKVAESSDITIEVYRHLGELRTIIPSRIDGFPVERIRGGYPALPSRRYADRKRTGKQLVVSTGALIHLARAVKDHVPQTTTFVTVAGNCIANPMNLEVSLGTTITHLIERCGLSQAPNRVISGGPMTGIAILDTDSTVVTPTTKAILAVKWQQSDEVYSCIKCGRCEVFCPSGLNPMYINSFVKTKYYNSMELFDPQYCIECGTCSYVCPSRLDLLGAMRKAKRYTIKQAKEVTQETEEMEGEREIEV